MIRVCLSCIVLGLAVSFADAQVKPVIPHNQTQPPGPALSPKEAIAKMVVPPGFHVELVAAEPDIVNPVAMAIDDKGRFWITESLEYPKRAAGPGRDRVKVLESTKGDGVYDKVSTVLEGLNIPSGIAVGHGGVWLVNSPDLLFYPFEDWDTPKLGKGQVVVTGFGRSDTHELPNSLTWGPDGWLYGLNGVFNHSHIVHKGKDFKFTCAMFRIHPRTKDFELFCEGTSNPWGIAFNENGDAFVSACVIDHLWHLVETGYYHRQGGPYPPFTWKIGSITKHKHQKAAYCGLTWFDSDAYPPEYRGKLYMGNIHGGCINSDELTRDGSTYLAKPRPDFLTANDTWFMPVVQKTGPDGCMYVLDWYDRYHCYQDANRDPAGIDRAKGRLYRVVYKDYKPAGKFDLTKESEEKLMERLQSANVHIRELAQRNLVERHLNAKNRSDSWPLWLLVADEKQPRQARMHAFWTLVGQGLPIPSIAIHPIAGAMVAKDASLRAWAIRAMPDSDLYQLDKDVSPEVLLQRAIGARQCKKPMEQLAAILERGGDDKLIPHIVWQNLHPLLETQGEQFLHLVATTKLGEAPVMEQFLPRVIDRILAGKNPQPWALAKLIETVGSGKNAQPKVAAKSIAILSEKVHSGELTGDNLKVVRAKLYPFLIEHAKFEDAIGVEAALFLASVGEPEGQAAARLLASQRRHGTETRVRALQALIIGKDPSAENLMMMFLASFRSSTETVEFRGQVISVLGRLDAPVVGNVVVGHYNHLEPELQPKAIDLLTQRASWSKLLLKHIEAKKIPASALNVNHVRKLLASKDVELVKSVTAVWGTVREGRSPEREKIVAEMRSHILQSKGDALRGVAVFKKVCAQCHKLHGDGVDVGPDITGNGRSDFEQLLSNVFDPSLVIGSGYQATTVNTTKGQIITGLLVEDNEQRVVLKTQGGKLETIARADVDELLRSRVSLMPEGLEKQLQPQEIADLFALLILDKHPSDPTAKKIPGSPK